MMSLVVLGNCVDWSPVVAGVLSGCEIVISMCSHGISIIGGDLRPLPVSFRRKCGLVEFVGIYEFLFVQLSAPSCFVF